MSSDGTTCDAPPPVPPPFIPKTGPSDGSRSATAALTPIFARPCARPIEVVVLPSPAGVGVIAETSTSRPRRRTTLERGEGDLRLGVAVGDQVFGGESQRAGDVFDRFHGGLSARGAGPRAGKGTGVDIERESPRRGAGRTV